MNEPSRSKHRSKGQYDLAFVSVFITLILALSASCASIKGNLKLTDAWPPPEPSTHRSFPINSIPNLSYWSDSMGLLDSAINEAGFTKYGIYEVPDGFAVVTRTEKIANDLKPLPGALRWSKNIRDPITLQTFSWEAYFRAFSVVDEARFRVFVFIVSDSDFEFSKPESPLIGFDAPAQGRLSQLPERLARRPITAQTSLNVLIYEYIKASGMPTELVLDSAAAPLHHLKLAGISIGLTP